MRRIQNQCHQQLGRIGGPYDTPPSTPPRQPKRLKRDFREVDEPNQVMSALLALYPEIGNEYLIVGSHAIRHYFPEYRQGESLDWDIIVPNLPDFREKGMLQIIENILPGIDAIPLNIAAYSVFTRNSIESMRLIEEFQDPSKTFISIELLKEYYLAVDRTEFGGVPKARQRANEIDELLE